MGDETKTDQCVLLQTNVKRLRRVFFYVEGFHVVIV